MNGDFEIAALNPKDGGVLACMNQNGKSVGIMYSNELKDVITVIECRKNGVPIGPQWAWYINGNRYYYNLWSYDGSGQILKWRTWNRDGIENSSDSNSICILCKNKIETDQMCRLKCWHRFHYECLSNHVQDSSANCPTCDHEITEAFSPRNALWLCCATARNFKYNLVQIADIFGNSMWLKCSFQTELPKLSQAKHVELASPDKKTLHFSYDSRLSILRIVETNSNKKLYIGNVKLRENLDGFEFEHEQFLRQNNLVSNPQLLTPISLLNISKEID